MIVAGFSGVYALGSSWIGDLEDYDVSDAGQLNSSLPSIMLASDGTELARFQVEYRDPVELDQISEYVREGTVATEDERFYEHGGFDLAGIARAVYVNLTGSGKGGRVHHHAAARAQHYPGRRDERYLVQAQGARDVPLRQVGGTVLQRRDPAHVP
ncbi:MAG: transglycosylase domain-containing protein [Eggerthellaceae bacterium]